MSRSATGQSCASPPVRRMAKRRPASASASTFVLRPPLERPIACFCSPLFHPLPSGALCHPWSRSSGCLPISRFRQVPGTDFPRPRAAPSARSGYRSSPADHRPPGHRTRASRFSTPALFNICTMPLMTRRSSTRSTPRTSVGKNGSNRFQCSSLSQIPAHNFKFSPNNHYPILSAPKD
jgi:hypothetical protein